MAAAPAKIYRGDTWARSWVLKDPAGAPIDLTGATARLQVRDADGVLKLEASSADKLTITPLQGRIDLEFPYADMVLAPGSYRFDLEVTFANGRRQTYEVNLLVILEDVTHD